LVFRKEYGHTNPRGRVGALLFFSTSYIITEMEEKNNSRCKEVEKKTGDKFLPPENKIVTYESGGLRAN
jgi:hypothetical protein